MSARVLEFIVSGQQIEYPDVGAPIVNETRKYLSAHFNLDAIWGGLTVHALFFNRHCAADPVELDETGTCNVPAVVLEKPAGEFSVGLVGYGEDGYRLTTDFVGVDMGQAAYTPGITPKPPAEDVYADLLDKIAAPRDAIKLRDKTTGFVCMLYVENGVLKIEAIEGSEGGS